MIHTSGKAKPTHMMTILWRTHASEVHTSKVEEYSLNEEAHTERQHKPENEDWHLLKLQINEMADQRFLDFIH